jgi:hypothetical protein
MRESYSPPMNTAKFTEWLQWLLGDCDDVKLENWGMGDAPENIYSVDDKISESIYEFCDGGARFQITITQLSAEGEE